MKALKKKTNSSGKSSKNSKNPSLSIKADLFCRYYLFGVKDEFRLGNATRSYAKAFELDINNPNKYNICSVKSSSLLRNGKIRDYMRELLDDAGFNDEVVDSRLLSVIVEGDDADSVRAIKEYNTLKKRVDNALVKLDVSKFLDGLQNENKNRPTPSK